MNPQIVKLFGLILVLYALIFGFTSYWSIFDAEGLENNRANQRPLLEEQRIERGEILAADGSVIARSKPRGEGGDQTFVRTYPKGDLFGNPIGYSFVQRGRVGFELSHNDELVGNKTEFLSVLDELRGQVQEGDDVQTALDPEAQQTAVDALAGQNGSVVALDPSTGEVLTMVSLPAYDPNDVPERFKELNANPDAPLFNRATQAGYPPGSTMKVVTAVAALDSGEATTDTTLEANSGVDISGVPLDNSGGADFGDDRHGGGADQLRQHLLGPDRRGHRHGHDVQVHGPVRVQLAAAARLPRRSSSRSRASSARTASSSRPAPTRSTSAAWRSARTSSTSPRCRWRWSRRPSPTAAS